MYVSDLYAHSVIILYMTCNYSRSKDPTDESTDDLTLLILGSTEILKYFFTEDDLLNLLNIFSLQELGKLRHIGSLNQESFPTGTHTF